MRDEKPFDATLGAGGADRGRAIRGRRLARCVGCGLPDASCLCSELEPIAVRTRVVVVAHRNEVTKTTNTGRLAARMLGGSLIARGVGPEERDAEPPAPGPRRLVLFPSEGAREIAPSDASDGLVLVVPDGSWSQARKIARRDPLARLAEPVTLPAVGPSRYVLRQTERPGGLCTLEAIAYAMGVLEGPEIRARLLRVLDAFVARQRILRTPGFTG